MHLLLRLSPCLVFWNSSVDVDTCKSVVRGGQKIRDGSFNRERKNSCNAVRVAIYQKQLHYKRMRILRELVVIYKVLRDVVVDQC